MGFIKEFISLQKGGYGDTCEITIRIALTYLLNNIDKEDFDPKYKAAQLYFCILFNDPSAKNQFLEALSLWLKISSRDITVSQPKIIPDPSKTNFYNKTLNEIEKKKIIEFNAIITTNEFNLSENQLKNFKEFKEFFMLTALTDDQKKDLIKLSTNDAVNCIDVIFNKLKEIFKKLDKAVPFNNYKDKELSNALILLGNKILEINHADEYNNNFLKKLSDTYIKEGKYPTPDINLYKSIECPLNKLYYLQAVQQFYNLMYDINDNYIKNLFKIIPLSGTNSSLYKFEAVCKETNPNKETKYNIDLDTSLDSLNTEQILDRINIIRNNISNFNKCFFKAKIKINATKLGEQTEKLVKIFNDINKTLYDTTLTAIDIMSITDEAEFHNYNRENINLINLIPPFNIENIPINVDETVDKNINCLIKEISRQYNSDLKEYLCKFEAIDTGSKIKDENLRSEHAKLKKILNEILKNDIHLSIIRELKSMKTQEYKKYSDIFDKIKIKEILPIVKPLFRVIPSSQVKKNLQPQVKLSEDKDVIPSSNVSELRKRFESNYKQKYLKYKSKYLQLKQHNSLFS